ncbi:MAG: hypothetical protein RIA72_12175 [Sphingopyxis sp.]|uniref:hypothetical protein n=1 Tax=Sphingopyxis sp. TaxID=1908224 RepID=UPI0032EB44CA
MLEKQGSEIAGDEWRPCWIVLPRWALLVGGYGVQRRWILPGPYFVRRSRSIGKNIYRRARD